MAATQALALAGLERRPRKHGLRTEAEPALLLELPARRPSRALSVSLALHSLLIGALVIVPLLLDQEIPEVQGDVVRAFFVAPDVAPPPPPPPPPAAGALTSPKAAVPKAPEAARFVAPIEVPETVEVEDAGLDLGLEGGVPGGVEGGVPGGVVGGVVGGLPLEAASPSAPPAPVVRVGGNLKPPRLVHQVAPEYPAIAAQARVSALVILEAHVGTDGRILDARILRGQPLFDDAALAAVRRWRYQPLLLNGVPREFVLTVTVQFKLVSQDASA
jgi:protein TonB